MPDYPLIELVVSVGTWSIDAEAYPDTGFEGGLAIPVGVGREIIADEDYVQMRLADAGLREVPTWPGEVELQGRTFRADVIAIGNQFLVGREVLDRLEICFHYGKEVRLRFTPGDD